jgi:hypothetical protein
MSTDYEINQQERVQNERFRRSSFAQLVHDRARGKDGTTFTPEYDDEDPDGLDPTNLASALGEKYMPYYTQLVRIEPPQAEPTIQAPLSSMSAPRPATATGGDATTGTLPALGQTLIGCINPSTSRRVKTVAQAFGQYEITNWSRPRGFDSGRSFLPKPKLVTLQRQAIP